MEMKGLKTLFGKVMAVFILAVLAAGLLGTGNPSAVRAAKEGSASVQAVQVKKAKKGLKVTSGNYVYKVTAVSKKKSTVSMVGLTAKAKKKLTKVVMPKNIKIKSKSGKNKGTYSYKVTAVAKNAFKGCQRIREVTIGENVITLGSSSFSGCTGIQKVTLGKSVKTIGESAFAGDYSLTKVVIPKNSKLEVIKKNAFAGCTRLKDIDIRNAAGIKKIDDSAFEDTEAEEEIEELEEQIKVEKYSYEVIPLMPPFNSYFYIKTDNPDPGSFRFVDESTIYAKEGETGSITPVTALFADVKYENAETFRVRGGYIASGSATDGGELKLQLRRVISEYNVYNLSTGETVKQKEYDYKDTTVAVKTAKLQEVVDYLITTYGDSSKPYFDNLSGIQSGFSRECLYSGVYVLGEQKKSESAPYYGLSTSPHVDQTFYIQDPYYRTDSKSMLVSALHPMRYDSIGFPSVMMSVARKLNSAAAVQWSSDAHYLIEVTLNGETRTYGGAGSGGGQGIYANQIKYWYLFDGSSSDAYAKRTLKDVRAMIQDYGAMEVPEEPTDLPKLTWASVRQTVGTEGAYVKLVLITSIFGGSASGYTYLYDDGRTGEGSQGWGAAGYFSNAWYDGRYFNKWEYFYPGAKFEETVKTESPSIIRKDVAAKLPEDGKTYYYDYNTMDKAGNYNAETGVWSGFMTYRYDAKSQTWKADLLNRIKYREGYSYKDIEDQDFIAACTITMEQALDMNLDANTEQDPGNYYIYDCVTQPGTYHSAD